MKYSSNYRSAGYAHSTWTSAVAAAGEPTRSRNYFRRKLAAFDG